MTEIKNLEYIEPFKILKFDVVSGMYRDVSSYEIPPANIIKNQWFLTSPEDYHLKEVRDLVRKAHETVWTTEIVDSYKQSREGEIVLSYSETTLSEEQFAEILRIVPDLTEILVRT